MPVELSVPTSFWPTSADLPMPVTPTRPSAWPQAHSRSTAASERLVQVVGHLAEGVRLVPEQVAGPVELGHLVHLGGQGRHGRVLAGRSGIGVNLYPLL